jgi:opacity protein-like surface antigen
MRARIVTAVVAVAAAGWPTLASAQTWSVQSGFTARGEYNDNYFFAPNNQQPAFTATATPFVTAARRTETSDVTALLAVGANKVWLWDPSETTDYLSGRLGLNGSLRDERSTWTGNISFSRAPTLQNQVTATGTVLGLANTNAGAVNGGYTYALTERWSLGATAGGFGNRYESVLGSGSSLQNNQSYYAGGNVGYALSDRTQFSFSAVYSHYSSDITRGDYVTTTLGVVHQFSPRLTISASVGEFWSDITATQTALVCPTTPILCDSGLVPQVPITTGEQRSDNGQIYGGNISYAFSERTQLTASLAENLGPSGTGILTKTDSAIAFLSHRFSDRMTGRFGASYTRQIFPTGLSRSSTTNSYAGEIGVSYRLAERWTLDAGYRYRRAQYSQNSSEPQSNVVFVSIGYGWPGASFTDWVGARLDTQGLAGAGPVSLSERSPGTPALGGTPGTSDAASTGDSGPAPSSPETSPFDQFTIP